VVAVVAAGDRSRPARDGFALASGRLPAVLATPIPAAEDVALAPETINLIRDMAARGRLWGAERIRGELLKLGIKVSKRTIQKYMRGFAARAAAASAGRPW
jgi:hypothetical protein